MIKQPSAFLPVAMSLAAIAVVVLLGIATLQRTRCLESLPVFVPL